MANITTTYIKLPNWKKNTLNRIEKAFAERRKVIHENALILLNIGLLYLNFANACQDEYSAQVEKYIKYFAIMFQGSTAKNYAGKMLHLVACLKKL